MTDTRQFDGPAGETSATETAKADAAQVPSTAADQAKQTASAAADAAGQTAATATEGAKQVASEAAQQVTDVTRQATEQARELVGQAQSQFHDQATEQTQKAATGLADVGRQLRALGDGKSDEAGFAADAARQLADKVEQFAGRIEQRGFDGTVEDLKGFARRRPGVFLLGAAAAGFAAVRLGKSAQAAQQTQAPAPAAVPAMATPTLPEPAAAVGPGFDGSS